MKGALSNDQDILKLISNLKNKKLIKQASLANMNLSNQSQGTTMKGFKNSLCIGGDLMDLNMKLDMGQIKEKLLLLIKKL